MLADGGPNGLTLMANEIQMHPEGSASGLPRDCRVNKSAHGGDAIGGNPYSPGVLLDGCIVGGDVDAVDLVAGYVAMEPLDLGAHSLQNVHRLLRDFPQLGVG